MDQTIDTTAVLEACETIMVGPNFQILAPGDVTFRAGFMVIFASGFSVESGATMSVWIDPSLSSN